MVGYQLSFTQADSSPSSYKSLMFGVGGISKYSSDSVSGFFSSFGFTKNDVPMKNRLARSSFVFVSLLRFRVKCPLVPHTQDALHNVNVLILLTLESICYLHRSIRIHWVSPVRPSLWQTVKLIRLKNCI